MPALGGFPLPAYLNWQAGVTFIAQIFNLDLRYYDTNLSKENCYVFTGDPNARRVAASIQSPILMVLSRAGAAPPLSRSFGSHGASDLTEQIEFRFSSTADIGTTFPHVRFGPQADIANLALLCDGSFCPRHGRIHLRHLLWQANERR